MSKDMPQPEAPATPDFRPPSDRDDDTDLSGYDTYPPTPEPREETPIPDDPWERLKLMQKRFMWDEEAYQFERMFLKERLIDEARTERENEEGDSRRRAELDEMEKARFIPGTSFQSAEYLGRMRHYGLRGQAWTQEQIDAHEEAVTASRKKKGEEMERQWKYPRPQNSLPLLG
jgi:hypothetical protein